MCHSDIVYSLHLTAPIVKLTEADHNNNMTEATEISCTTRCDNIIAWRVHSQASMSSHPWYRSAGRNKSNNQCTEVIALTSTWPQYINTVSVQCVAVYVCHMAAQDCKQRLCVSEVQGMYACVCFQDENEFVNFAEVSVTSYEDNHSRSTTAAVGKGIVRNSIAITLLYWFVFILT